MKLKLAAAISAVVAACGGSSQNNVVPTATLTGAISADLTACSVAALVGSTAGNFLNFTCSNKDLELVCVIKTGAAPTTRTYASTDANAEGSCNVVQGHATSVWASEATPTFLLGAYSLTITSLGTEVTNLGVDNERSLSPVHGSISCTATPAGGDASGAVNMVATF
jgi:hypothetical protein